MNKYLVLVAGGKGLRMGGGLPKQFMLLAGKPVLFYSIIAFLDAFPDIQIILVLPAEFIDFASAMLEVFPGGDRIVFVTGGETRFHSVKNGLGQIKEPGIVFVHDGARPLIAKDMLVRCYEQAVSLGSAIPVIPVAESVRMVAGKSSAPVDRNSLYIVQTPQTFRTEIILPAFTCEYRQEFTDEATVVETDGTPIHLVEGNKRNIKITMPEDLVIAEALLGNDISFR